MNTVVCTKYHIIECKARKISLSKAAKCNYKKLIDCIGGTLRAFKIFLIILISVHNYISSSIIFYFSAAAAGSFY